MTMPSACTEWARVSALYDGGEAAPMGAHLRECPACRARAAQEAPEALFALLADPPAEFLAAPPAKTLPFPAPRRAASPWLDGLRQAASILLVMGCAWGGYLLYRGNAALSPASMAEQQTDSSPKAGENLRARYPLVRHASPATPYYTATLEDGTRLVHFHVPEL